MIHVTKFVVVLVDGATTRDKEVLRSWSMILILIVVFNLACVGHARQIRSFMCSHMAYGRCDIVFGTYIEVGPCIFL